MFQLQDIFQMLDNPLHGLSVVSMGPELRAHPSGGLSQDESGTETTAQKSENSAYLTTGKRMRQASS